MNEMSKEEQMSANGGYYYAYCVYPGCNVYAQGYNLQYVKQQMIDHCNSMGGYTSGHRYRVEEV
jgi:hypothetical protein